MNSSPPMRVTRSVGLHCLQSLGHFDQKIISLAVAQRVVDQLEAVKIQEERAT